MIPLFVMLAIGTLSALWPGPKLDHRPPISGGIWAPRVVSEDVFEAPQVSAPLTVASDPCGPDDCGKAVK